MPSRFNLGLIPANPELAGALIALAQANCALQADAYCLGEHALPHITLCQFDADAAMADKIWREASALLPGTIPLRFTHVYIQPGFQKHEGYLWCGLAVEPDGLPALQRAVFQHITGRNLTAHTQPQQFFPHVTWARLKTVPFITYWPENAIWHSTHAFHPALGLSDENGVWVKTAR